MQHEQFGEPTSSLTGPIRNLRNEAFVELKQANLTYNECFNKSFLPKWFAGEKVNVSEVCGSQYDDLMEKHSAAYENASPIPFRTFQLPTAQQ